MNKRQKLVQQEFLNKEEAIIRRLRQVYDKAFEDINEKLERLELNIDGLRLQYDWLEDSDPSKEKIRSMIQSKIYQKQYQQALQDQIEGILEKLHTEEYLTVADYLSECYGDSFIGSLFDLHGQDVPLMIPLDQTKVVRAVQLDSKISQGLYTRLGQDVDLLKKRITAQVSRSVANGSSYGETARQLNMQSRIGMNNAIRIARTEGHRIQTTAAMDVMEQAKEKGADVVKQWDAALDGRTRASHRAVDGEIREVEERFSNGLNYPGDPAGGAKEVINCRCALLQRCRDFLDEQELAHLKERADFWGLDKSETFKEFKEKFNIALSLYDITEDGKYIYLNFRDANQYADYIEHEFATQKMTVKELNQMWDKVVGYIQNSQGYQDINGFLRGLKSKLDNPKRRITINVMDRLTKNNTLQKDYIGVRKVDSNYLANVLGLDVGNFFKMSMQKNAFGRRQLVEIPKDKTAAEEIAKQINNLVGTDKGVIPDKAFTSVSMSRNLNYFTHFPVRFEIQMPAGTHGVLTNNLFESEFIIKRDSSIEIIGAEVYNDGEKDCVKINSRLLQ